MKEKETKSRNGYLQTKNSALLVRWNQDVYAPAGIGILECKIPSNGESYKIVGVPKAMFTDLLRRSDPEFAFNNLLRMFMPPDKRVEPKLDDYSEEW